MPRLVPRHSLWIRITHWINVIVLSTMVYSGLLIYWANDVYKIELFGFELVKFFPDWFYKSLGLEFNLATGMAWHFSFAWLFVLNGLVYVSYLIWSGEWKDILPNRSSPYHAMLTVLHDLKIRKEPPPPAKLNGAQRFAYTGVIGLAALSVITGFAILKPEQLGWLTTLLGGYQTARLIHFAVTILFVLFVLMHVSQVVKAGWGVFRAMITGYEVHNDQPK